LLEVLKKAHTPEGKIILSDPGRPQMDRFLEICSAHGFRKEMMTQAVHLPDRSYSIRITTLNMGSR